MHNMSLAPEIQFPIDEISSPLGAQLEFSESELFPETLQNSEVASISSNITMDANTNNNYNNIPLLLDHHDTTTTILCFEDDDQLDNNASTDFTSSSCPSFSLPQHRQHMNNNYNNIPLLLDHHDTTTTILCFEDDDQLDNNASTDFTSSSCPSFSLPQHRQHMNNNNYDNNNNNNNNEEILFTMPLMYNYNNVEISLGDETYNIPEQQPVTGYNTEESGFMSSLITVPSHNIDPISISIGNYLPFSFDVNGLFLGNDVSVHNQELFYPDSDTVRVFNYPAAHLQAVCPMASEISSLEDHNDLKVGKLSVEERKRKIYRYLKKRNERNFSKKIKYACRKTLADSRPRVRGRFAKNDEIARTATTCNNHEDDTDEDGSLFSNPTSDHLQHKVVKADEDLDSLDVFAHISGVNTFDCNYSIQSWI